MISRLLRPSVAPSLLASAFSCTAIWASPLAAQPAPDATAPAPPADATTPTPAAPAPAVTPAPTPSEPAPATGPIEAKPKDQRKNGKVRDGKVKDDVELGAGDPRTPDQGGKAARLGGSKVPNAGLDEKAAEKYGHIEIHGRVFARATLSTREVVGSRASTPRVRVNALDLSLPSARLGFDYQSPLKWLAASLEAELTDRSAIKDGFVRARKRFVTVKAGQFKMPISALTLESAFSLPMVDRGLLHDYVTDDLQVGGRRIGVSVEVHDRDAETGLRPTLTVGAFQGSARDQDGNLRDIEDETLEGQSYAARVELRPGNLTFGLSYQHRVGPEVVLVVPEGMTPRLGAPGACVRPCTTHYFTFGVDAALDMEFSRTGLRLWLDGLAGRSWMESARKRLDPERSLDASFPVFGSLRGVVAFRVGGMTRRDLYVEPFAMAGVLDPDLAYARDHVAEWMLGVNVGRWKLARVGLEGSLYRGAARLPAALGGDPDRMGLMLQGAVAF